MTIIRGVGAFPLPYLAGAVLLLVAVNAQNTEEPLPPPPNSNVVVNCSIFKDCWTCTSPEVSNQCLWCLAAGACFSEADLPSDCRFTAYTDCCVTLGSCSTCVSNPRCGFCADTQFTGCMAGNASGPHKDECHPKDWYYSNCAERGDVPGGVVLGLAIALGGSLVILSVVLLVNFVRRYYQKKKARREIKEFRRKLSQKICDNCRDRKAVWRCLTCSVNLCDQCVHTEHQLQTQEEYKKMTVKDPLLPTTTTLPATESNPSYTTFNSLIRSSASDSYNSFTTTLKI